MLKLINLISVYQSDVMKILPYATFDRSDQCIPVMLWKYFLMLHIVLISVYQSDVMKILPYATFDHSDQCRGWSGGAKVLCILHHWGVQLILAYSWARPAILVVGKGRGGMFLFLLLLHFHSCSSFFPVPLFHLLYSLVYLLSPFLWETTQNDPQGLTYR